METAPSNTRLPLLIVAQHDGSISLSKELTEIFDMHFAPDIAGAIDNLRKWKQGESTERVPRAVVVDGKLPHAPLICRRLSLADSSALIMMSYPNLRAMHEIVVPTPFIISVLEEQVELKLWRFRRTFLRAAS
jgi:hypothetical protein